LRFFPQEIKHYIYKDICPEEAYLTQEEILNTVKKIELDQLEATELPNKRKEFR
jgi:hypothetical protein